MGLNDPDHRANTMLGAWNQNQGCAASVGTNFHRPSTCSGIPVERKHSDSLTDCDTLGDTPRTCSKDTIHWSGASRSGSGSGGTAEETSESGATEDWLQMSGALRHLRFHEKGAGGALVPPPGAQHWAVYRLHTFTVYCAVLIAAACSSGAGAERG